VGQEIKYDGYRLRVERDDDRVRLITRGGYDWTKRFPWTVESALKNRQKRFVIDGEAVILGVGGISDFDALHSGSSAPAMDGDDLRRLPLSMRKTNLARLLARRPEGIFLSPFEQGEIGPDLFRKACEFGLEGLVSKHRDRPYQSGRSKHWIKVKNRQHHAFARVQEADRSRNGYSTRTSAASSFARNGMGIRVPSGSLPPRSAESCCCGDDRVTEQWTRTLRTRDSRIWPKVIFWGLGISHDSASRRNSPTCEMILNVIGDFLTDRRQLE
jgi:hypothetical protein